MRRNLYLCGVFVGLISLPFVASASILHVPGEYPTIQAGIEAADNGDTVLVADGVYDSGGDFLGKDIKVCSENGPLATIVDCDGGVGFLLWTNETPDAVIQGLTIKNAAIGILCFQASCTIEDCIISDCTGIQPEYASGIHAETNPVVISDSVVRRCIGTGIFIRDTDAEIRRTEISESSESGIRIESGTVSVLDCEITDNSASESGGGIYLLNANATIQGCFIARNRAITGGGIDCDDCQQVVIGGESGRGNHFADNRAAAGAHVHSSDNLPGQVNAQFNSFTGCMASDYYLSPPEAFDLLNSTGTLEPITQDVYVSPSGDDSNTGLTPESPFQTIQHAMSVVLGAEMNPITVHLATGVYAPSVSNEVFPIPLLPFVSLTGMTPDPVILDAEKSGPILWLDRDGDVLLENFSFLNGDSPICGGLYSRLSDITVTNCEFHSNSGRTGGAIQTEAGTVSLIDCDISNNHSTESGGGLTNVSGTIDISGCSFSENSTDGKGGGMSNLVNAISTISNCVFHLNRANTGGGGIHTSSSSLTILESSFTANEGGGLYLATSHLEISDSIINGNSSDVGGGLTLASGFSASISGCAFFDNTAEIGGAIYSSGSRSISLNDCDIKQNQASSGGGLFLHTSYCTITGCNFTENIATDPLLERSKGIGGGIYAEIFTVLSLHNSVFESNVAHFGGAVATRRIQPIIGGTPDQKNYFWNNFAGAGADLCMIDDGFQPGIITATNNDFTGNPLSDYYVSPQSVFDTTGSTGYTDLVTQDVFVSPEGDDSRDGLTPETSWRTIRHALMRVSATESAPLTIHLGNGIYSPSTTGEQFPLPMLPYVSFSGSDALEVTLDAEQTGPGLFFYKDPGEPIRGLRIRGAQTAGIYFYFSSHEIDRCEIVDNSGSGIKGDTTILTVKNTTIARNVSDKGGGIHLNDGGPAESSIDILDCVIHDNIANGKGGGILSLGRMTVTNSAFSNNRAGEQAGGVFIADDFQFTNVIFDHNYSIEDGGAVFNINGSPNYYHGSITNCSFYANESETGTGGGISVTKTSPTLRNCIFWGDSPDEIGNNQGAPGVAYSIVSGGYPGIGNIDSNPLFVSGPSGDYYLSNTLAGQPADSPAIDAGDAPASEICFESSSGPLCMSSLTTRTDTIIDESGVDLGFHYGDAVPAPTPVPTPSSCSETGVALWMPAHMFSPGDQCTLIASICNRVTEQLIDIPFFCLLEVADIYLFYPVWSETPDRIIMNEIPPGETTLVLIDPFTWPSVADTVSGVRFLAAITNPEITDTIGVIGEWEFTWSFQRLPLRGSDPHDRLHEPSTLSGTLTRVSASSTGP